MSWIHYLLEANLYLVAFYALYVLFLRSETLYQLNRAYLLLSTLLAFIIPVVQFGVLKTPLPEVLEQHISIGEPDAGYSMHIIAEPVVTAAPKYTLNDYLLFVYGAVALVLLIHLAIRVYLLMALARKGAVTKNAKYNIIEMGHGSVAFSFLNNLFIDNRLASSQTILYHEQVHIRQRHSWDIIYLEMVKIINWFNPVVYFVLASIKELHEFIADEQTIAIENNNNDDYTDFLISNAYGITQNSLTNAFFNKNLLKRRITMLYQKRSGKAARLKYLLALPLLGGLLCASTMAFTTKTYGLVDVMPAHSESHLNKPANVAADIDGAKKPLIILNKKTFEGNLPVDIDIATAGRTDYERLIRSLNLDKELVSDFSILKPDVAKKLYGTKGESGVLIINTRVADTPGDTDPDYVKGNNDAVLDIATGKQIAKPGQPGDKVFTTVDHTPEFPGGQKAFGTFLAKNIHYPAKDKENKVQGKVYIQFVVEKDGALTDMKALRSPSAAMSDESMRVLKLSPKWKPGMQDGKKVRVQFVIPINFALNASASTYKLPPPPPRKVSDAMVHFPRPVVTKIDPQDTKVYNAVTVNPDFPGGESGFTEFLAKNIRYPAIAHSKGTQGKVYAQFTVEKDGSLSDIKVLREPGDGTGDEAVRVLKMSPKWKAGIQDGKLVRVQYTVPINFVLDGPGGPADEKTKPKVGYNPNPGYPQVKVTPQFPGGYESLANFLSKNIRYPREDKLNNVQGKVKVQFVVEKDGSLTDMKVINSPSDAMATEALRVMKLSPKWQPAVDNGEVKRVEYTLPINFSLGNASGSLNPLKRSNANDAIASADVSTAPQFPGGQKVFEKFLAGSILYPEQDKKNVIEGTVQTQFVIEKDGKLDNIKVTQAPTKAMADEAIRVLTSSPKWTPGQQDGKTVRVAFNVPINFSLNAPRTLGMHVGNINTGKAAEMPDQFYRMADMMIRPQMVYIQVDHAFDTPESNRPIGWSEQIVYMVDGKIYTSVDLERRSAAISSGNKIATLLHAQTEVYHKPNNKEDIDKYGEIAKNGIFEFKGIISSNL